MKTRKLMILWIFSALLGAAAVPGGAAQDGKDSNYQMNLAATYAAVKEHEQVEALPPEKKVGLWEAFLAKFPTDNAHADEARERIAYWKGKAPAPPATSAPAAATAVPATAVPPTSTAVPATATPEPTAEAPAAADPNVPEPVPTPSAAARREADTLLRRARGLARRGRNEPAIELITKALKLVPGDAGAHVLRGTLHARERRYEAAAVDLDRAIELDASDETAFNRRGLAHERLGRKADAMADYTRALELEPRFAQAWYNRGRLHYEAGDTVRALADYNEAVRLERRYSRRFYDQRSPKDVTVGIETE